MYCNKSYLSNSLFALNFTKASQLLPWFLVVTRRNDVSGDVFDVGVEVGFVGQASAQARRRNALAEVDLDADGDDVGAAAGRRRHRDVVFAAGFVRRASAQVVDTGRSVEKNRLVALAQWIRFQECFNSKSKSLR